MGVALQGLKVGKLGEHAVTLLESADHALHEGDQHIAASLGNLSPYLLGGLPPGLIPQLQSNAYYVPISGAEGAHPSMVPMQEVALGAGGPRGGLVPPSMQGSLPMQGWDPGLASRGVYANPLGKPPGTQVNFVFSQHMKPDPAVRLPRPASQVVAAPPANPAPAANPVPAGKQIRRGRGKRSDRKGGNRLSIDAWKEEEEPREEKWGKRAVRPLLTYASVVSTETKTWEAGSSLGPVGWEDQQGLDAKGEARGGNGTSFADSLRVEYKGVNGELDDFIASALAGLDQCTTQQCEEVGAVVETLAQLVTKLAQPNASPALLEKFKAASFKTANATMPIDKLDPGLFDIDDPRMFHKVIGTFLAQNRIETDKPTRGAGGGKVTTHHHHVSHGGGGSQEGRSFGNNAHDILSEWYNRHEEHPYPEREERERLAQQCGITTKQLANWFGNKRKRERQKHEEGQIRPRADSRREGIKSMMDADAASDLSDGQEEGEPSGDDGGEKRQPWLGVEGCPLTEQDGWTMSSVPREGGGRPDKTYYAPSGQKFSSLVRVKSFLSEGLLEQRPVKRQRSNSATLSTGKSGPPPKGGTASNTPTAPPATIPLGEVSPMLGGLGALAGAATDTAPLGLSPTEALAGDNFTTRPRSDSGMSAKSGGSGGGDRERVCAICKPKHRTVEQCRRSLRHAGPNWNDTPQLGPVAVPPEGFVEGDSTSREENDMVGKANAAPRRVSGRSRAPSMKAASAEATEMALSCRLDTTAQGFPAGVGCVGDAVAGGSEKRAREESEEEEQGVKREKRDGEAPPGEEQDDEVLEEGGTGEAAGTALLGPSSNGDGSNAAMEQADELGSTISRLLVEVTREIPMKGGEGQVVDAGKESGSGLAVEPAPTEPLAECADNKGSIRPGDVCSAGVNTATTMITP